MTEKRKRKPHPIDQIVMKRVRELREERRLEQKDVADAMRDKGFQWSQTTVWSVEKDGRPLRIAEALALSEILSGGGSLPVEELVMNDALLGLRHSSRTYEGRREAETLNIRYLVREWWGLNDALQYADEQSPDDVPDYQQDLVRQARRLYEHHTPAHVFLWALKEQARSLGDDSVLEVAVEVFREFIREHEEGQDDGQH